MACEPVDGLARLRLDFGAQGFLFGVGRAGEQEVLPSEHAAFVAELVEVVAFVDSAAPDAEQVHVRELGLFDAAEVAGTVDAVQEGVVGNPVGAPHEHRLPVHDDRERRAAGIRRCVELDGAESD